MGGSHGSSRWLEPVWNRLSFKHIFSGDIEHAQEREGHLVKFLQTTLQYRTKEGAIDAHLRRLKPWGM